MDDGTGHSYGESRDVRSLILVFVGLVFFLFRARVAVDELCFIFCCVVFCFCFEI